MAEPARSRKMVAQRLPPRLWGAARSEDEARAYLQERLTLFSKLMFWSIAALMIFLVGTYRAYDEIAPKNNEIIFGTGSVALLSMALIWRGLLVRRKLSLEALYRVDLIYSVCLGSGFGMSAVLAPDLRPAAYASLLYACFSVFTRAILVPSTGRRTAVMSIATFVPMNIAGLILALRSGEEGYSVDLPPSAFVGGGIVFSAVSIVIATTGSRIIYGLRQKVSEAMQLGSYTLDRKIGEGGMGMVYRAHHALLRRPTAIKLLLPDRVGADNIDRFEREVQGMSQLTHPNTVAVYDYGRNPDGVLYYAMEYLDGIDLEALVRTHGPQPSDRVIHILAQVCGALQEAHDAGLIHRDIKPANIILCERGGVPDIAKVVDYGLVKEITRESNATTQVILGTPAYVAPEAVTDPDMIGFAVDYYALGAVGYFLLTGRRVFEGKTAVDICIQHVMAKPRRPSEVVAHHIPADLEEIIMKCLEKAPADRFPSAGAIAEALGRLPRANNWGPADAKQFWKDHYAAKAKVPSSDTPTLTITVDLGSR